MKTRRTGSPENKCSSCDVLDLPTLLHGTKMHSFKANLNLLNVFEILSARWPGPQVAKNNDKDWWSVQQKSETFLDMVNWLHPQVSERLCCSVGSSSDRVAPDLTHQPLLPKRFNPRSFTKTPRPWLSPGNLCRMPRCEYIKLLFATVITESLWRRCHMINEYIL